MTTSTANHRYLRRSQVEELVSLSRSSLYRLMRGGLFPHAAPDWSARRTLEINRNRSLLGKPTPSNRRERGKRCHETTTLMNFGSLRR